MSIGAKLSEARKKHNMTQEELAYKLSVSRQSVSKWESDVALPDMDKVIRLCEILEINCDYLLKDNVTESGAPVAPPAQAKEPEPRAAEHLEKTPLTVGAMTFITICLMIGIILAVLGTFLFFSGLFNANDIVPVAIIFFFGVGLILIALILKFVLEKPGR